MSRLSFFFKRLVRMDWHKMWKTTAILKKRSGHSRLWLLMDMLRCGVRYNAGYMDYMIAEMYRLNDEQKRSVIDGEVQRHQSTRDVWFMGIYAVTEEQLRRARESGEKLKVRGYGLAVIDRSLDDLALETIGEIRVKGKVICSERVRAGVRMV